MRFSKSHLVFLFDLLAAVLAWGGGFWIRFNFEWWPGYTHTALIGLAFILPVHALVCRWAGLYRGLWVFASLPDLKRMMKAIAASLAAVVVYAMLVLPTPQVPRSLVLLYPVLLTILMGGGRATYRMWKEHRLFGGLIAQGKPVLIIGAGRAAAMLVRELERSPDWRVVGLLDDDKGKWGRDLGGHRVLGPVDSLSDVAEEMKVQHAILAMPAASAEVRRHIAKLGVAAHINLLTVPGLEDIMSGSVSVHSIRRISIDDLLGRDAVKIDTEHVAKAISGKTVLVTGAGGSIGSELCRQIGRFAPKGIILFEQSEFALYTIQQWFEVNQPNMLVVPLVGDVKDAARLNQVFADHRPEIVFHAAAYKHVPLMETGNAWQAVRNNVLGTLRVAQAAHTHTVDRFVLISTDKAVNPTNVMGATKRLAEMVCLSMQVSGTHTQYQIVRFGNVLGSAGSVIPKFQEQIARGGPITVTHPEIVRYFMSIPEAAQLVLQAAAMGKGGEVFVLDMGKPVKIVDLARNMIRLSGFSEDQIRIEFTGLRPGEKLYEELLADAEVTLETPHAKLRVARPRPVQRGLDDVVQEWDACFSVLADDDVKDHLRRLVPEFISASPESAEIKSEAVA